MSAQFGWSPQGRVWVSCYVYPDSAPILSASDDGGACVTISSGTRSAVSAEHAEFAREFAEAARRYAEECARWAERGRVGAATGVENAAA